MHTSFNLKKRARQKFTTSNLVNVVVYDEVIGKGSYSKIYLGCNTSNHSYLAIKVQPYSEVEDIQHEINQLKKVGYFVGEFIDRTSPTPNHYLAMPYFPGMSIEELYKSKKVFSQQEMLELMILTAKAMWSVHRLNLIHNDIHEGNLIFDERVKKVHWVDFAFAIELPEGKEIKTINLGKKPIPVHKAPESNTQRGYSTDLYQLGFMLLRMQLILTADDFSYRHQLANSREFSLTEIQKHIHKFELHPVVRNLLPLLSENWLDRPSIDQLVKDLKTASQNLSPTNPSID